MQERWTAGKIAGEVARGEVEMAARLCGLAIGQLWLSSFFHFPNRADRTCLISSGTFTLHFSDAL
jgi:hypothetical protein